MSNHVEIRDLKINHKTFEGVRRVLDIDCLDIEKGTTYGLVGESGAGKTVLALALQRLLSTPPGEIESGSITIDGIDILGTSKKEMERIRGSKISMIFQDPMSALNPVFTVGRQMRKIVLNRDKADKRSAEREVLEMIRTVRLPDAEKIVGKYPHELSGGQRQRIIIGMALLCGAEFIIADEPTRNLDVTIQAGILKLISDLQREKGVTVLFIANNLGLVSTVCDRLGILKAGSIVERGTADEVLSRPKHEYTRILIDTITPAHPEKDDFAAREEQTGILEVKNLKKYFPVKKEFFGTRGLQVKAVDDVDVAVSRGDVLGVVGESGCGKSTLVNTILFLTRPTAGRIVFDGRDISSLDERTLRRARKDVQIVFQDPYWSLNPRWLVRDIIGEPLKVHKRQSMENYIDDVQDLMEMVGLNRQDIYKYPHEFSGGQRQRIAIARALSVRPKLVVLDEPTSAIDVISQAQILRLLVDLKRKLNLTYIIISHDLSVVNFMADRIMIMYLGKVVEYGDAPTVFEDPRHPYTRALFDAIPGLETRSIDDLAVIRGEIPSAIHPPPGCRFHTRCPECMEVCRTLEPDMKTVDGREVCCHLY